MTNRTGVGIATTMLFASLSSLAAQAPANARAYPARSAVTAEPQGGAPATICDGSEIRSARHRGAFAVGLMAASLPVALVGMYRTAHSSSHPEGPVRAGIAGGAGLVIAGFALATTAHPNESFWQQTIARLHPGETRSADVRTCLERPIAEASTDSTEEWTYLTSRGLTGRVKTVRFTFRDSVLVGIRRAEVDAAILHNGRGPLFPPVTSIPDPR